MEIEMVEMGSDKASPSSTSAVPSLEFTTLASSLDKDYDKLEGNKHLLNRKTDRLSKFSIGNKALLPQQVRVRLKAKAKDDARMCAYIEQENITDLALFQELELLRDCCQQSQASNCIIKGFTSDTAFNFLGCCYFVRRYLLFIAILLLITFST